MALYSAVLQFSGDATSKTAALATVTSSGEIVVGNEAIFAIIATNQFNLKFGNSGMAAAAATDMLIPANTLVTLSTSTQTDRLRVFNPNAGAIDVYVQRLSRF